MKPRNLIGFLASQDWPTVLHTCGAFLRELRKDGGDNIAADQAHAIALAKKTRDGFETVGRKAIGCAAPAPCECAFCTETETPS